MASKITVSLLAAKLFKKHNVSFDFVFDKRPTKRIGVCDWGRKVIGFSTKYLFMPLSKIKDTILHEIAHYIDYKRRGTSDHSKHWKKICVEIGAQPKRCKYVNFPKETQKQCVFWWFEACQKFGKFLAKESWEKAEKKLKEAKKKIHRTIKYKRENTQLEFCF